MNEPNRNDRNSVTVVLGFTVLALSITGIAWAFLALMALAKHGDYVFVGGGLFAIASALSFGLLLNGLVRS